MKVLGADAHGTVSDVLDVRDNRTSGFRNDVHVVSTDGAANLAFKTRVNTGTDVNVVTGVEVMGTAALFKAATVIAHLAAP